MSDIVENNFSWKRWGGTAALVGGGLVVGALLAGTLTANADDNSTPSPDSGGSNAAPANPGDRPDFDPSQSHHPGEELLTGDNATKVREAALAKYPKATIQRVETDSDGVYEAHLVTAGGSWITVEVNKDFEVTGTEAGPGPGGPGGRGHGFGPPPPGAPGTPGAPDASASPSTDSSST